MYTTLWKSPDMFLLTYVPIKAFMVVIVPFIHNRKAVNVFRPVEERGERNALGEIDTEPKRFVYVSLKDSIISSKLQMRIIFLMILKRKYQN